MTKSQVYQGVMLDLAMTIATIGIGAWLGAAAQAAKAAGDAANMFQKLLVLMDKLLQISKLAKSFVGVLQTAILTISISKFVNTLAQACVMSGKCSEKTATIMSIAVSTALSLGAAGAESGASAAASQTGATFGSVAAGR